MDETNIRLARWIGWEVRDDGYWRVSPEASGWGTPKYLPDFTTDLNACFRWIVPKVFSVTIGTHWKTNTEKTDKYFARIDQQDMTNYTEVADTPALALCLAVDKLIKEKEDERETAL